MYNVHDNTANDHTRLPSTHPSVLQVAKRTKMAVSQPEQLTIELFELRWLPYGAYYQNKTKCTTFYTVLKYIDTTLTHDSCSD